MNHTTSSTLSDHLKGYHILLASQSPRRQELLKGLDIDFEIFTLPGLQEEYPSSLKGTEIPLYLSKQKASAYFDLLKPESLLITADTIVWLNGSVFGKPKDSLQAKKMLQTLSGQTHQVITGVCITTLKKQLSFTTSTQVTFSELSDEEIDYYISKYMPFDKAGSYGVQEWIGYIGVEHIEGSYFNVMGLPIQRLYRELKQWDAINK